MQRILIVVVGILLAFSGTAGAAEMNTSAKCPVGQNCQIRLDNDLQLENRVSGDVDLSFHDYADTTDDDMQHVVITANCTDAATTTEDCNFSVGVVEGGSAADTRIHINADGGVDLGSAATNDFTVTTDGASMDVDNTTANTLTFTAATTGVAVFQGADAASPAATTFDTTGAGAILLGSADVTTIGLVNTGQIDIGVAATDLVAIVTDGGTATIDGYVQADVGPFITLASGNLTANTIHIATAAATYTIPACVAANIGEWVTVIVQDLSEVVILDLADASNTISAPGAIIVAGGCD